MTFHNGLTIVAKSIAIEGDTIKINEYSVCNGCQSLVIFFRNRHLLTSELETLVRFVLVDDDRARTASIAYRTNNQNSVSLRDLSANDNLQVILKAEFDGYFGETVVYGIKRGAIPEKPELRELPNELAGQMLLALYVKDPANAHQKHRIFGDRYREIFPFGRNAAHIRLADLMMEQIQKALIGISNEKIRTYGLTKYVVLYLVGEVLRQESDGQRLLDQPLPYLQVRGAAGANRQVQIMDEVFDVAEDVVTELEDYISTQDDYDYKSRFKAGSEMTGLRSEVIKSYKKDKRKGRATVFSLPTT